MAAGAVRTVSLGFRTLPTGSHMLHLLPTLLAPALFAAAQSERPTQDLVAVRLEDPRTLLRHRKDQGLARVAALLDERLAELPGEVPGAPPIDPAWIALATELCTGALTLRMGLLPDADPFGPVPPFYGRLELHRASADEAAGLADRVLAVLRALGAPEPQSAPSGLRSIPGTPIPTSFGAAGNDVVLDLGAPAAAPVVAGDPLLPQGAVPRFALHMDCAPLMRFALDQMERQQPEVADFMGSLCERLGLDDLQLHVASASDDERSYTVTRIPGHAETLRANGFLAGGALELSELALVPRDATWASIGKVNFAGLFELFVDLATDALAQQGMEGDPVEIAYGMTGFHLRDDLVALCGETYGMYASDTTGGGGLMSTVLFVALRDGERALETRERLEELLNGAAALQLQGYVQVRASTVDGVEYATLTFPGLPVPLEPTIAITDSWLFVGASKGAALEAVRQARATDRPNLLDHPGFQAQLPGGVAGLQSVAFQDGERLVRAGYGTVQMAASALANAVRSRRDGLRDAGEVLPSYTELARGALSTVSVGRLMGADLVVETRGDASVAVQLATLFGWVASNDVLFVLPMLAAAGTSVRPVAVSATPYRSPY
jgi:hypothetical protein